MNSADPMDISLMSHIAVYFQSEMFPHPHSTSKMSEARNQGNKYETQVLPIDLSVKCSIDTHEINTRIQSEMLQLPEDLQINKIYNQLYSYEQEPTCFHMDLTVNHRSNMCTNTISTQLNSVCPSNTQMSNTEGMANICLEDVLHGTTTNSENQFNSHNCQIYVT